MWLKFGNHRINMDNVIRYYSSDSINDNEKRIIYFHMDTPEFSAGQYSRDEINKVTIFVYLSAEKVCEYLDNLIISKKDEDIGMLIIDKEFEERIKDVEFKTMEEFKEVEIKGFKNR